MKRAFGLDFDDAYQFAVARELNFRLVTQDRHFERVRSQIEVVFIGA